MVGKGFHEVAIIFDCMKFHFFDMSKYGWDRVSRDTLRFRDHVNRALRTLGKRLIWKLKRMAGEATPLSLEREEKRTSWLFMGM